MGSCTPAAFDCSYPIHLIIARQDDSIPKGPATQNAVCRSGLRSLSAAECYILSRLF